MQNTPIQYTTVVSTHEIVGGSDDARVVDLERRLQKAQREHVAKIAVMHERLRATASQKAALADQVRNA